MSLTDEQRAAEQAAHDRRQAERDLIARALRHYATNVLDSTCMSGAREMARALADRVERGAW